MLPGLATMGGFVAGGATAGSFDVDISTDTISKTGSTSGAPKTLTTTAVSVTPHGGSGSYTYAWTRIDGDAGITATSPALSATNFSALLASNDYFNADFVCTVTDSSGATATASVNVSISLVGP